MEYHWHIELLGGLSVTRDGERTTKFATQKTAALLAFLAFYRGKPYLRDTLVEMLWPEADPSQGRSRLSTLLSYLRHLLEPPGIAPGTMVRADRSTVEMNADLIATDVARWESALSRAAKATGTREQVALLEQARCVYGGDLLPGFYETWIAEQQPRLREKHADTLLALALGLSKLGDAAAAVAVLDEAIAADPYREALVRLQMRCYAAIGRMESAFDVYRRLSDRLREDLDTPPAAATRSLAERMRADPTGFSAEDDNTVLPPQRQSVPEPALPPSTKPPEPEPAVPSLPLQLDRFIGRARSSKRASPFTARSILPRARPTPRGRWRSSSSSAEIASDPSLCFRTVCGSGTKSTKTEAGSARWPRSQTTSWRCSDTTKRAASLKPAWL